jgi:2-keto-4-pentenoate hydratase/2-oxohepta-3-ene-1,7-dioic acid hydratase in catechol pathway
MRIAHVVSPEGLAVIARVDGEVATPVANAPVGIYADALRDLLAEGVDIGALRPIGENFPMMGALVRPPVCYPGKIVAVGLNYADHAREANLKLPSAPMIFAKFPTSIIGHGEAITFRAADTAQVDYEAELAVVIGRRTRDVEPGHALKSVFGYTMCNDVSARDAQFSDGQFTRGKSFDTFCPVGPYVVTADEIEDPQDLSITARVNGTTMQDSSTKEMIFSVAEIISYVSRFIVLEPGDIIATGTPAGVGMAKVPPRYLTDGDVVEIAVSGLGVLSNPVAVR